MPLLSEVSTYLTYSPFLLKLFLILSTLAVWYIFSCVFPKKTWRIANTILIPVSVFLILNYSVLGRVPNGSHKFLTTWRSLTVRRDMVMNILLYIPLGLSLAFGLCSIPITILTGFLISLSVEIWQFYATTGISQFTDVLCNTFGTLLGSLCYGFQLFRRH